MEEVGRRLLSPWLLARPVPTKKGRTNSRFSTLVAAFFGASLKLLVAISTPQESYTMDATGFWIEVLFKCWAILFFRSFFFKVRIDIDCKTYFLQWADKKSSLSLDFWICPKIKLLVASSKFYNRSHGNNSCWSIEVIYFLYSYLTPQMDINRTVRRNLLDLI